jgi:hypothetical protein
MMSSAWHSVAYDVYCMMSSTLCRMMFTVWSAELSTLWHVMFSLWWTALSGMWYSLYDEQHSACDDYFMMRITQWHVMFTVWWAVLGIAHESFMHISKLATVEMITFSPSLCSSTSLSPESFLQLVLSYLVFWFLMAISIGWHWKMCQAIRTLQLNLLIWFLHFGVYCTDSAKLNFFSTCISMCRCDGLSCHSNTTFSASKMFSFLTTPEMFLSISRNKKCIRHLQFACFMQ